MVWHDEEETGVECLVGAIDEGRVYVRLPDDSEREESWLLKSKTGPQRVVLLKGDRRLPKGIGRVERFEEAPSDRVFRNVMKRGRVALEVKSKFKVEYPHKLMDMAGKDVVAREFLTVKMRGDISSDSEPESEDDSEDTEDEDESPEEEVDEAPRKKGKGTGTADAKPKKDKKKQKKSIKHDDDKESDEDEFTWVALVPATGHEVGDAVDGVKFELGKYGLYEYKDKAGVAVRVRVLKSKEELESAKAYVSKSLGVASSSTDVRVLEVTWDASDERWKSLSESYDLSTEEDYVDWPLRGTRSTGYTMRQLKREQLSFLSHSDEWARRSGVPRSSRAVHEHKCLSRALHFLCCYDQLNLPNLAGAEVLVKRRALIESAHKGSPESPMWDGADEFMGIDDAPDGSIIDPAAEAYRSQRLGQRTEIMKQMRLSRNELGPRRWQGKGDDDGDEDGGGAASAGRAAKRAAAAAAAKAKGKTPKGADAPGGKGADGK